MPASRPTILVTLTGHDRPGVTSALVDACSVADAEILDIEQILVRGRLVLAVLLTEPRDSGRLIRAVEARAAELGMQVEFARGEGDSASRAAGRTHVTMLGAPLRPSQFAAVTGRIADTGANIDRIVRMARYPVTAIAMDVSGADPAKLRTVLSMEAAKQAIDVAVQPAGLNTRAQRLIVMDVDSTLVQGEVIDLLAAHAGRGPEVERLTDAAMHGEIDFATSLRERVAALAGVPESALDEVHDDLVFTPGARTMVRTLKRLGYRFAVVSGGFSQITDRIAERLGVHYAAANTLEIEDGRLTGRLVGPVLDREGKAAALRRFADEAGIDLVNTVAIGDGANDLDMLATAGLGIAFNAKAALRDAADTSVTVPYLDAIVYLLGISREEVEASDAAAGITTPAPAV